MKIFKQSINNLTKKKAVLYLVGASIAAILIETTVLATINRTSCTKTMTLLSSQVATIIDTNSSKEEDLLATLKEEYIVRAKAVAHFLAANPKAEEDISELVNLSDLLEIDEIHIFDSTGTIVHGTEPKYYGYSFDSGEQMAYFKPMLSDKSLSMCQDMTPNTAEGKNIMYAITWKEDGSEMVQVGIQPKRLTAELQSNDISEVINNVPQYDEYNIYVADATEGTILGSTDRNRIGQSVYGLGYAIKSSDFDNSKCHTTSLAGFKAYYLCQKAGGNVVIITHTTKDDLGHYLILILIESAYLSISGVIIYLFVTRLLKANNEKNDQLCILKSMSDIYYSMHLIDLESDTAKEYKAKDEVKEIADHEYGASEMMRNIISTVATDEYLEQALEFTDLSTVRQRMRDKKLITYEFIGRTIGWSLVSFITIDTDHFGMPRRVMFVSRCIEEEKRREEALIRTSNTDELTRLNNRRAYENEIDIYTDTHIPEDLVYIALDINGLKHINDTLGHAAGDELIKGAAACIKDIFSSYGKVFRTGGDEFIAIINVPADSLSSLKEKFDSRVNSWSGKDVKGLSVSSGYVTGRECSSIKEMSLLADRRMYEAKNAYYVKSGFDRRKR